MRLDCWRLERLLRSREREDLTAAQRRRLEAHLSSCKACADAFTPLEAPLADLLRDEAEESARRREERVPGELFRPRLEERLHRAGSGRWGWHLMRLPTPLGLRMPQALAGTLVLVLVLAAAFWVQDAFLRHEEGVRVAEIPLRAKKEAREEPREPEAELQSPSTAPLAGEEATALVTSPAPMRDAQPERTAETATVSRVALRKSPQGSAEATASPFPKLASRSWEDVIREISEGTIDEEEIGDEILLMFQQRTTVRLRGGKLVSLRNVPGEQEKLEEVTSLLEKFGVGGVERCPVEIVQEELDQNGRKEIDRKYKHDASDENLCYILDASHLPRNEKAELFIALQRCGIVEAVSFVTPPAPNP